MPASGPIFPILPCDISYIFELALYIPQGCKFQILVTRTPLKIIFEISSTEHFSSYFLIDSDFQDFFIELDLHP